MATKSTLKRSLRSLAGLTLIAFFLSLCPSLAQNHYQIGIGSTNILDTYLSQEKFHGTGLSFLTTSDRQRDSSRWLRSWQHQVHISTAKDRADNASLIEAMYKFHYGFYRTLTAPRQPFELHAGLMGNIGIGVIYDTRNGNNPVQARFGLHIMPSAKAAYHLRLFRHDAQLRYQIDLPLVGVVFSPNYGQSYYELFSLGNYDHNIVPTTFVSAPNFRQQLSLLYALNPKLSLSLGYLGDYQQQKVNNLKQHVINHVLMLGIAKGF